MHVHEERRQETDMANVAQESNRTSRVASGGEPYCIDGINFEQPTRSKARNNDSIKKNSNRSNNRGRRCPKISASKNKYTSVPAVKLMSRI